MDDPDLLSLGQHCSVSECRQRDFLPFTCDCCKQVYCLEHRTYSGHNCQKAETNATTTILCPLCARAIKIGPNQNPNIVFEEHTAQDCDPSNYAKVMRKRKCPVPGCKEKLTSINTYKCKHCSECVCLKHRFPEDHSCSRKPKQGNTPEAGAMASLRNFFSFESGKTLARGQESGRNRSGSASQRHGNTAKLSSSARSNPTGLSPLQSQEGSRGAESSLQEVCPVCRAAFHSLNDLIAHSTVHEAGFASPEVCPHCAATFLDAVSLVEHVERQHSRSSSNTACVLS